MHKAYTFALLSFIAAVFVAGSASAHPSDGQVPQEVNPDYGKPNYGFHSDLDFGAVTFVDLPTRESLTDTERYMLAGCQSSPSGDPLDIWYFVVWGLVSRYWQVTHTLPESITPEVLKVCYGEDIFEQAPTWLEEIKNPITGEYPRITADEFSPGDLFVHVLTPLEINNFASKVPAYNKIWVDNIGKHNGEEIEVEMATPIMYIRVYGETQVIENHIIFSTVPAE